MPGNGNTLVTGITAAAAAGLIGLGMYIYSQLPAKQKRESLVDPKEYAQKPIIKAILFDMDGTLLDSAQIWYELLRNCSKHFGYGDIEYDVWHQCFGQSMQKNVDNFMPGFTVEVVDDYCCTNYANYVDKLKIIDGAIEAVEYAKHLVGNNIYIVTNCPRRIADDLVKSPKASPLINIFMNPNAKNTINDPVLRIICLCDPSVITKDGKNIDIQLAAKPSPDMIYEAARRLNVKPSECILVGDSQYDMSAIEAAGGYGVGIKTSTGSIVLPSIRDLFHIGKFFDFQKA